VVFYETETSRTQEFVLLWCSEAIFSVLVRHEHSALIKRLCGIVSSALQIDNSVLIVATAYHREQLIKELNDAGGNVREHASEGRFALFTLHLGKENTASCMAYKAKTGGPRDMR
jgi:hypothetical protein